jgi:hypothetical protein
MKLRWKIGIAILATLLVSGAVDWFTGQDIRILVYFVTMKVDLALHPPPPRCKQRADEFNARVARIQQDAKNSLKVGTKKDDVVRFFAAEKIPVTFVQMAGQNEATGTITSRGDAACRSIACGDDAALIGVRVDVDESGTVESNPVVVGMLTNCL